MSVKALSLHQLCLTGPGKPDALVKFHLGLNVIYGASDSGKSFILELIQYMLGASAELRDFPERGGYTQVWLTLARQDKTYFTFYRGVAGGDFYLFEGIHTRIPASLEGVSLKAKHSASTNNNVSSYILAQIDLANKKIRRNVQGENSSFTLSSLRHLCFVAETDIPKQGSPILTGQYTSATAEMSAFKLLVTGEDDSTNSVVAQSSAVAQSNSAKLEVLNELITSYEARFIQLRGDIEEDPAEWIAQTNRLDQSIAAEQEVLTRSESLFADLYETHRKVRTSWVNHTERAKEAQEMIERFRLLQQHYRSDIARLEAIEETGSLISAFPSSRCPLCGAEDSEDHAEIDCDANLEQVVAAAAAEKAKIERLSRELAETTEKSEFERAQIVAQAEVFSIQIPDLESRLSRARPALSDQRTDYRSLIEKKSEIQKLQSLHSEIEDLKARKKLLEGASDEEVTITTQTSLPASVMDLFSQELLGVLKAWHFPDANRIHFDPTSKDFVIDGKPRGSRGKGMRAITYAAFTVSLLQFCRRHERSHLGFIAMDSPLLAYREPDAAEDEQIDEGLKDHFFSYLASITDRQCIIIENIDPPEGYKSEDYSVHFTGNSELGRSGLFPSLEKDEGLIGAQ